MRQVLAGVLLASVLALAALGGRAAPAACEPAPGTNGKYVKPSSLAPGERAYHNVYGAPIPKPIVSRRAPHKAKTQPQLHSAPLPAG
jgi:hypothetical protein